MVIGGDHQGARRGRLVLAVAVPMSGSARMLARALHGRPWFAPVYYTKLLIGHAAGAGGMPAGSNPLIMLVPPVRETPQNQVHSGPGEGSSRVGGCGSRPSHRPVGLIGHHGGRPAVLRRRVRRVQPWRLPRLRRCDGERIHNQVLTSALDARVAQASVDYDLPPTTEIHAYPLFDGREKWAGVGARAASPFSTRSSTRSSDTT